MALDNEAIGKLVQQLEADRTAYLATFAKVQETLAHALNIQPHPDGNSPPVVASPLPAPSVSAVDTTPSSPRSPPSLSSRRTGPGSSTLVDIESRKKGSLYTGDESSDSDDDESFFAQEVLPVQQFSEEDLRRHLKDHQWNRHSTLILQDLLKDPRVLDQNRLLERLRRRQENDANHHHADIYQVGTDGAPLRHSRGDSDEGLLATWEALRQTNVDRERKQAVGRIIVLREPPPVLFAALHLTMNKHFDMDSIYRMMIDDETSTKAYIKGCISDDHRHQRSLVFCFKYHTIVGEGRAPLPWQNHDNRVESREDHISIATCSSIVALSLSGGPSYTLRRNSRKAKPILGFVYDPFAPWHVLSIQCFPDWHSSVDVHQTNHHYVNGPDAFLATLLAEYRDAARRFRELNLRIMTLASPPGQAIFDSQMRDGLLFENDKYTYTRRYFWASQTLGLLSHEIKAMITAYKDTFTEEVWSGEHKTLFPGTKDQSLRYNNWRKKLAHTRKLFEKEIAKLEEVHRHNQQQQKDIRNLREWLFSGTSVQESREAVSQAKITVEQGYNIKVLTLVSIFFLPLTFVTSVFGMTNMPPNDSFRPFAITTACICLPTYLLILMVNDSDRFQYIISKCAWLFALVASCFRTSGARPTRYRIRFRREEEESGPTIRRTATYASLEGRLPPQGVFSSSHVEMKRMSVSQHDQQAGTTSGTETEGRAEDLGKTAAWSAEPVSVQRTSTIKFEEPASPPSQWRTGESAGMTLRELEGVTCVSAPPTLVAKNGKRSLSAPNGTTKSLLRRLSEKFSRDRGSKSAV